jgi:hypothetical protein
MAAPPALSIPGGSILGRGSEAVVEPKTEMWMNGLNRLKKLAGGLIGRAVGERA